MSIAWQRFHAAALALARSGSVKDRLQRAYRQHLADLDAGALPTEVRGDFLALGRALTREKPMRGEDAVAATIRKLSNAEVDDLATSMIEIYGHIARLGEVGLAADRVDVVPSAGTASGGSQARVIPLFAEARS
jgi:hypothetical protein